jgi:hypothetical protein
MSVDVSRRSFIPLHYYPVYRETLLWDGDPHVGNEVRKYVNSSGMKKNI